jgi:hypothetical protein
MRGSLDQWHALHITAWISPWSEVLRVVSTSSSERHSGHDESSIMLGVSAGHARGSSPVARGGLELQRVGEVLGRCSKDGGVVDPVPRGASKGAGEP